MCFTAHLFQPPGSFSSGWSFPCSNSKLFFSLTIGRLYFFLCMKCHFSWQRAVFVDHITLILQWFWSEIWKAYYVLISLNCSWSTVLEIGYCIPANTLTHSSVLTRNTRLCVKYVRVYSWWCKTVAESCKWNIGSHSVSVYCNPKKLSFKADKLSYHVFCFWVVDYSCL